MTGLPSYIYILFALAVVFAGAIFLKAARYSKWTGVIFLSWLLIQSLIALSGFYKVTDTMPPRFLLMVVPPIALIAGLFFTKKGRDFMDHLDPKFLTLLHTVRIPVELVLYGLFLNKAVPQLMTFEGKNADILAGLSAIAVFYFAYVRHAMRRKVLLMWNVVSLMLLVNIIFHAVFSAPTPLQMFGFEQPNIAVFHFPFNWLPSFIVPLVMCSHLVLIRKHVVIRQPVPLRTT